jgi:hypothetical protein
MKKRTIADEIDRLLVELSNTPPGSEEYEIIARNLKELCDARSKKNPRTIDSETVLYAVTNIVGILLVLNYEHLGVISSKAFSMVVRRF